MKAYKIRITVLLSCALVLLVLGCVFCAYPYGFASMSVNVAVVNEVKLVNDNGDCYLEGTLKNNGKRQAEIRDIIVYCQPTNFEGEEVVLTLERGGVILAQDDTYDFARTGLQFTTDSAENAYSVRRIEVKAMDGGVFLLYQSTRPALSVFAVVLCFLAASALVLISIALLGYVIKGSKRIKLSKDAIKEFSKAAFLLGAICQKGEGNSNRTFLSTLRGAFRAIFTGVKVYRNYEQAVLLDMVLTENGLYIERSDKDVIIVKNMKLLTKEKIDPYVERVKVSSDNTNVVMDFCNGSYIVIDVRSASVSKERITARLKALFYNNYNK
ncbi:MAG: hypothetical protein HDT29_01370 [Clostridiales bacterium]|nr:hypothetical protein [Clostridiales bacterium]